MQGFGCRVSSAGRRIQAVKIRSLGFTMQGLVSTIQGSGLGVQGSGFRGAGFRSEGLAFILLNRRPKARCSLEYLVSTVCLEANNGNIKQ